MAGLIKRAVQSLYVKDTDTSRVRDNIIAALNPVLTFLTNNFAQDNPVLTLLRGVSGSTALFSGNVTSQSVNTGPLVAGPSALGSTTTADLTANGPLVTNGTTTSNGAVTLNGDVAINGNVFVISRTVNGVAIRPQSGGSALYITNSAGSVTNFAVDDQGFLSTRAGASFNGTAVANSFISASGFKSFVPMGVSARGGSVATGIIRANTASGNPWNYHMPFAGSVIGLSIQLNATVTQDVTVQVFKNAPTATTNSFIDTMGVKSGALSPASPITFTKGMYSFGAGDVLGMGTYCSIGQTFNANCGLVVEFGA